jgi:pimeloyl-ACP methyl ester carboxylesterase
MNTRVSHYLNAMYGGLPPPAADLRVILVHELKRPEGVLHVWRVQASEARLSWMLHVSWPAESVKSGGRILLSPDACWPHCVNEGAARTVHAQGITFASFDRLEVAHDSPSGERSGPLFDRWPNAEFGALSAWAWAMGHTALALQQVYPSAHVGVIGHSRGGKAALLAAALYPSIAAVISHNSGAAGASSLQRVGAGAESLNDLAAAFPHWLGLQASRPGALASLEADDGVAFLQSIAPRGLMIIQGEQDAWANPEGARHRYSQMQSAWRQRPDALALLEREGGHAMGQADWAAGAGFLQRLHLGSATIQP